MRKFLLALAVILPQPMKQALYRHAFGWKIGPGARIGFSYVDARDVVVMEGARIGHLNVFRRLNVLRIGRGAHIRHSNEVVGASAGYPHAASAFTMEDGSSMMGHHYIDCPGRVVIGERTVLGGRDIQVWSHSLEVVPGGFHMHARDVRIGKGVYIGGRATILAERVPDGAVVAAGSVVNKSIPDEDCRLLIAGNPATVRKRYEGTDPGGGETHVTLVPGDA
jgi:acetyltransferase-like isoleucine patch superfamily enzyme